MKIPLRLDEVVKETIASMQTVAKKRRIRLVEQPAQRLPPVAADKSMITQAVKNLVSNAIEVQSRAHDRYGDNLAGS